MKNYAVAMFFEKTVSVSAGINQLQQRLELVIITAKSKEEALGIAIRDSEHKQNGFSLVFNITKLT